MASPRLSPLEYKVLLEQAPVMIWRANTTAECDYFNDRWLQFRGRTLEEEHGNGWAEGVHAEDLDYCLRVYRDAFRRRESSAEIYTLSLHDGSYRWILDRGSP